MSESEDSVWYDNSSDFSDPFASSEDNDGNNRTPNTMSLSVTPTLPLKSTEDMNHFSIESMFSSWIGPSTGLLRANQQYWWFTSVEESNRSLGIRLFNLHPIQDHLEAVRWSNKLVWYFFLLKVLRTPTELPMEEAQRATLRDSEFYHDQIVALESTHPARSPPTHQFWETSFHRFIGLVPEPAIEDHLAEATWLSGLAHLVTDGASEDHIKRHFLTAPMELNQDHLFWHRSAGGLVRLDSTGRSLGPEYSIRPERVKHMHQF